MTYAFSRAARHIARLVAPVLLVFATSTPAAEWTQRFTASGTSPGDFLYFDDGDDGALVAGSVRTDRNLTVARFDPATGAQQWSATVDVGTASGFPDVLATADGGGAFAIRRYVADSIALMVGRVDGSGKLRWVRRIGYHNSARLFETGDGDVVVDTYSVQSGQGIGAPRAVLVLDADDGSERWRRDGLVALHSDGDAVIGSDGTNLLRLRAADGAIEWTRPSAGAIFARGNMLFESAGQQVPMIRRIDAGSGATLWEFAEAEAVDGYSWVVSANGDPVLVFGSAVTVDEVVLRRISAQGGASVWRTAHTIGDHFKAAVVGSRLVVGANTPGSFPLLFGFDIASGTELWRRQSPVGAVIEGLAGNDTGILIAPYEPAAPRVLRLDPATGADTSTHRVSGAQEMGGSAFTDGGEYSVVAVASRSGAGHVVRIRGIRNSDGTTVWEHVHENLQAQSFSVGGGAVTTDGRVVIAVNRVADSDGVFGSAYVYSYDVATGTPNWERKYEGFPGNWTYRIPGLVAGSNGTVHARYGYDLLFVGSPSQVGVRTFDAAGNVAWDRTVDSGAGATPPKLLVVPTGVVALSPAFGGVALLRAADGTIAWSAAVSNSDPISAYAAVAGDDLVVTNIKFGNPRNVPVDRFALADGTVRWRRLYPEAVNGMGTPFGIAADAVGDVYVSGRGTNPPRSVVMKLDAAAGDVEWSTEAQREADSGFSPQTLDPFVRGTEVWARQLAPLTVRGEGEAGLETRMLRFDTTSGALLGTHVVAAGLLDDHVLSSLGASSRARIGADALLTQSFDRVPSEPQTFSVSRVDIPPAFEQADLAVTVETGTLDVAGTPSMPFVLRVSHSGSVAVERAVVRARLPAGFGFSGVTCTAAGGACRVDQLDSLHVELDLPAGGTAAIGGVIVGASTIEFFDPPLHVTAELPFRFGDSALQNNRVDVQVGDPLFRSGFE